MENQFQELRGGQVVSKIEHAEVDVELIEDSIIIVSYKAPYDVDIALIEKVNKDIIGLVQDTPYTAIVLAEPGVNFTAEGRKYAAEKGHVGHKKAWAAVTENLAQILVVNFFMKFNKPRIPFKLFKTMEEAKAWLSLF